MEILVLIWLLSAVVGFVVGQSKGLGAVGFLLGLFLGLIGILIIAGFPRADHRLRSPTHPAGIRHQRIQQ